MKAFINKYLLLFFFTFFSWKANSFLLSENLNNLSTDDFLKYNLLKEEHYNLNSSFTSNYLLDDNQELMLEMQQHHPFLQHNHFLPSNPLNNRRTVSIFPYQILVLENLMKRLSAEYYDLENESRKAISELNQEVNELKIQISELESLVKYLRMKFTAIEESQNMNENKQDKERSSSVIERLQNSDFKVKHGIILINEEDDTTKNSFCDEHSRDVECLLSRSENIYEVFKKVYGLYTEGYKVRAFELLDRGMRALSEDELLDDQVQRSLYDTGMALFNRKKYESSLDVGRIGSLYYQGKISSFYFLLLVSYSAYYLGKYVTACESMYEMIKINDLNQDEIKMLKNLKSKIRCKEKI